MSGFTLCTKCRTPVIQNGKTVGDVVDAFIYKYGELDEIPLWHRQCAIKAGYKVGPKGHLVGYEPRGKDALNEAFGAEPRFDRAARCNLGSTLNNSFFRVIAPFKVWWKTGNKPSNAYYGASRIYEPTYIDFTAPVGAVIAHLPAGTFISVDGRTARRAQPAPYIFAPFSTSAYERETQFWPLQKLQSIEPVKLQYITEGLKTFGEYVTEAKLHSVGSDWIPDLRKGYDEKASVIDGTLYRKGRWVQVWWTKDNAGRPMNGISGRESWESPDLANAIENFKAMKKRWNELDEHIVKHGSGYRLVSHKGKNLGDFDSKAAAAKHEGEVEYFKKHEDVAYGKAQTSGEFGTAGFPQSEDSVVVQRESLRSFIKGKK
jgi:hypothetical protein